MPFCFFVPISYYLCHLFMQNIKKPGLGAVYSAKNWVFYLVNFKVPVQRKTINIRLSSF